VASRFQQNWGGHRGIANIGQKREGHRDIVNIAQNWGGHGGIIGLVSTAHKWPQGGRRVNAA
jgi:hypothetical protein